MKNWLLNTFNTPAMNNNILKASDPKPSFTYGMLPITIASGALVLAFSLTMYNTHQFGAFKDGIGSFISEHSESVKQILTPK